MVAGYSGLGKTSFIRTLHGTLKLRTSASGLKNKASAANLQGGDLTSDKRATSPTSPTSPTNGTGIKPNGTKESIAYATGELKRTLNSFEALYEIDEGNEKINLTLVDTPGFVGTDEVIDAHCDEILRYLEYQFDLTLAEERKVRRNPKAVDNQIHACLYFIDHATPRLGLSDADVRILKRLGTRVNLIPVIARADTLTRAQTKRLKQAILKDAAQHQIQFFQFLSPKLAKKLAQQQEDDEHRKKRSSRQGPGDDEEADEQGQDEDEDEDEDEDDEDDWDPEYLEEKAHLQSLVPFTVIAQEEDGVEIRDERGKIIQGREFPWGVLRCLDSNHCDLGSLRSALLLSHRQELKEITYGYFYEKYRTEKLLARTKSQHIAYQQQQQLQQQHQQHQNGTGKVPSHLKGEPIGSSGVIAGPWEE
ncbi:Septin-domain-containing protein [Gamsiella multidivaricata]|uniref:Septin-domain-containing protein n=1 Tax=Gamsiella multidivaricata TaxID=101098 RepID=UPI0022202BE8|nr:Septin-domain-containing protein [Gamsiella multidivaricata]KAI7831588.1 Septin-domain-containing protein [Gamsiella multidivaricata]